MVIKNNLSWLIGGAQGSGVDTSASVFAMACARGGLYAFGKREYYSTIKGDHSYFQIRVGEKPVRSHIDGINLLASFDADTLARHAFEVESKGGVIYSSELVSTKISQIPTLEKRVASGILSELKGGESLGDLLKYLEQRGVKLYPLPYLGLLKEIAKKRGDEKIARLAMLNNTIALGASFALLKFDLELLNEAIRRGFAGKKDIAEMNITAGEEGYRYIREKFGDSGFEYSLEKARAGEQRIFLAGTQAVAIGKLLGGGRFQTYYPITPASDESEYLESNEIIELSGKEKGSILVFQTEDEIAAITMATGAALTGTRASTSTSGPGFSLMVEGLGYAGMNEIPVVITYYQRTGPSTGFPTRHEQGDLRFAIHAGHGEFPRIVLASSDIIECFYDAVLAFNYAERYQTPVIHLIDKAIANSSMVCGMPELERVKIDRGLLLDEWQLEHMEGYTRFKFTDSGVSPRAVLGMKNGVFWCSGDEHDELGHICEVPANRLDMMNKRMKKLETAAKEIPNSEKAKFYGNGKAETAVVSWGSPKGAILDAMELLLKEGIDVKFIQLRLLNPFPTALVIKQLENTRRKIDIEMNYSAQLAGLITQHTGIKIDNLIVKYNGRPFSRDEVYSGIKNTIQGTAPERQVMAHGA